MGIEQKNYEQPIELKDSLKPSIDDIKSEINQNLSDLGEIDPENEQLTIIKEKADLFKNNEKALLVISEGLKKINDSVKDVALEGKEKIRLINKKMLAGLEELEREKELESLNNII